MNAKHSLAAEKALHWVCVWGGGGGVLLLVFSKFTKKSLKLDSRYLKLDGT